jgi:hypothetical protein
MALEKFMGWFQQAPRPGFTKATISAWRVSLEVLLDVRFPQGSPVPRAQLQKTLDALIPSEVKRLVSAKVDEF